MAEIMTLQDMIDMIGGNFISYIRFKKEEESFMKYLKLQNKNKDKSNITTKKKQNN